MTAAVMLRHGRDRTGQGPPVGAPEMRRAWTNALIQAGMDAGGGLPVQLRACERRRITLDELVAQIPDHALIALLEGPFGQYGLALLDPTLAASLVECRMTGQVAGGAPPPRTPTRTDGVLAADFLDRTVELMEGAAPSFHAGGFRFAHLLADRDAVTFTLDDGAFAVCEIGLALGGGGREGRLWIAAPEGDDQPEVQRDEIGVAQWGRALEAGIMDSDVALRVELARLDLPLSRARSLQVGDVLALEASELSRTRLIAADGAPVATGQLGRMGAMRAVRLAAAVSLGSPGRTLAAGRMPALADPNRAFDEGPAAPAVAGGPAAIPAGGPENAGPIGDEAAPAPAMAAQAVDLATIDADGSDNSAPDDPADDASGGIDDLDELLSGGFGAEPLTIED